MMRRLLFIIFFMLWPVSTSSAQQSLTIDARDASLNDVVRLLALQSGRNIIADGSVKDRRVSFRIHDVTPDEALAAFAQAFDLQVHRSGKVVLIGDAAAMNRRFGDDDGADAGSTEIFGLHRARPEDMAATLLATLPVGAIAVADKRTSSVIVTADPLSLARARRLVAALDETVEGTGTNAVTVSLRNAKASEAARAIKAAFPDATLLPDDRSNAVVVDGRSDVVAAVQAFLSRLDQPGRQVLFEVRVTDVKPVDDSSNVGLQFGGTGFGSGALGQFPYTLTRSSLAVNAQLDALVQTGRAQILATPRIATLNNHEAALLVGETYPIVTLNQQTGYPTVSNVDVGVQLRVTPTIGDDATITAELHPSYSAIIGFNSSYPIIANRKIDATLRVHDGETIVLGGLFEETSSETIAKLPFLGDLPILGPFFRNKAASHQRDEVVFLITPHVLDASASTAAAATSPEPHL